MAFIPLMSEHPLRDTSTGKQGRHEVCRSGALWELEYSRLSRLLSLERLVGDSGDGVENRVGGRLSDRLPLLLRPGPDNADSEGSDAVYS
jgi:hypothetical protein